MQEPVLASGQIRNIAGVLKMNGTVRTTLHGVCDRCAADFTRDISFPIDTIIVSALANDNGNEDIWTFELTGNDLDLDEIVSSCFVLNMDTQLLCREDCKGICCGCGKNLNFEPCVCKPLPDPRFEAIRNILENNNTKI